MIRRVQFVGNTNGTGGTYSISLNPITSGNFLVIATWSKTTDAAPTISDNLSSAYSTATTQTANSQRLVVFYLAAVPSGITTITISGNALAAMGVAFEYSGVSGTLDQVSTIASFSASTTWASNSITTTANDLLFGVVFANNGQTLTFAPNTPFKKAFDLPQTSDGDDMSIADQFNVSPGTYTVSGTCLSGTGGVVLLSFTATTPVVQQSTVLQQNRNTAGGPSTSITLNIATNSGSLLVAFVSEGSNATDNFTVTDSAGQTWQQAGSYTSWGLANRGGVFFIPNSAAVTSVTANFTTGGGVSSPAIEVYEISGAGNYDNSVNSNNSAGSTTVSSGSLTTTDSNDVLILFAALSSNTTSGTATPASGWIVPWTDFTGSYPGESEYAYVSSPQNSLTTSMTISPSLSYATVFVGFADVLPSIQAIIADGGSDFQWGGGEIY